MRKGTVFGLLLALVTLCSPIHAQSADGYEPDEVNPPWIGLGERQARSFYPEGDVDYARLRVKAGRWYEVGARELAPLVDTVLTVEVGGVTHTDDDGGDEPLACRLTFQAAETGEALITIGNSQGVYSTTQTYTLYAGEAAPPTPLPTPTAKPTRPPAPTPTPGRPIVSFSATPDRIEKPGECVTLRWSVERASEVYLIWPNGNREGVVGQDQRQVCPLETAAYHLEVHAPGGDETVEVQVRVPLPTPTPQVTKPAENAVRGAGKGAVHAVVFVDENRSGAYDPQEGVLGAGVTLISQADPGRVWTAASDELGQVHFEGVPAGSYSLLIPHLGFAETVTFRGDDLTVDVLVAPIQLPSRIP